MYSKETRDTLMNVINYHVPITSFLINYVKIVIDFWDFHERKKLILNFVLHELCKKSFAENLGFYNILYN